MPKRTIALGLSGALLGGLGFSLVGGGSFAQPATSGWTVVLRDDAGDVLAEVPLPGRRFAVSYRNSLYGSLAESRYRVAPDGRFHLVEIAAEERAVIEEYYVIAGPSRAPAGDRRTWVTAPARPAAFEELQIAATDLGERTLHVPGHRPVQMWRMVGRDPVVELDVEEGR